MKKMMCIAVSLMLLVGFACVPAAAEIPRYTFCHLNQVPYSLGPATVTFRVVTNEDYSKYIGTGITLGTPVSYIPVNPETGLVHATQMESLGSHGEELYRSEDLLEYTVRLNSPGYYYIEGRPFIVFDPENEQDLKLYQEIERAVEECAGVSEKETAQNLNTWVGKRLKYGSRGSVTDEDINDAIYCYAYNTLRHGYSGGNGYAELYQFMLGAAGIECFEVNGTSKYNSYTWVLCRLDGVWCFTDTLLCKTKGGKHFALSKAEMDKDHQLNDWAERFYNDYFSATPYDLMIQEFDRAYTQTNVIPKALRALPAVFEEYQMPQSVKAFTFVKGIDQQSNRVTIQLTQKAYMSSGRYNTSDGRRNDYFVSGEKENFYWANVANTGMMYARFVASSFPMSMSDTVPSSGEQSYQEMIVFCGELADTSYTYYVPLKKGEYVGYGTDSAHIYVYDNEMTPLEAGWRMTRNGETVTVMVKFDDARQLAGYSVRMEDTRAGSELAWECLADGQVVGLTQINQEGYFQLEDVTVLQAKGYMKSLNKKFVKEYPELEAGLPEGARCYRLTLNEKNRFLGDDLLVSGDPLFIWTEHGLSLNPEAVDLKEQSIDFAGYDLDLSSCSQIQFQ